MNQVITTGIARPYWDLPSDCHHTAHWIEANARLIAQAPTLKAQRDELLAALKELRMYADLKLQGHRQDYPEEHCVVKTALRMIATADAAIAKGEWELKP